MKKAYIILAGIAFLLVISLLVNSLLISGKAVDQEETNSDSEITLKVEIPCSGHASLIKGYLLQAGVSEVSFRMPDYFDVKYDSSKVSKEQIFRIDIFKEYAAREVQE